MNNSVLVRYGRVSEVAQFACELEETPARGDQVVVQTHRGLELGLVLNPLGSKPGPANAPNSGEILRKATPEDRDQVKQLQTETQAEYSRWLERISEWNLQLELIDLEWTLDRQKLILYVLADRGPETTKLALQAAAAGLAAVDVQPVGADGIIPVGGSGGGGGCGSGGCGCH